MPKIISMDFLRLRRQAYQLTFSSPIGQRVLEDLAEFCRANETCFHADPRMHAVLEGRREVWLRIRKFLDLTAEQQAALMAVPQVRIASEGDTNA
ncbi:hypothetical protein UFOVP134_49 [uncultured Caudovirales phage]|uniref:Bbp19-like phage domain-containing protein n=1 Tax=uncultured Caudovirales phage TaxID=2100421 RepID=A0A6J5LEX5_9CAUD|nr:hypothetical protein UFOVP134_49 [uncultured Caudovirales phage]